MFNHAIVYVPKYELWLDGTAEYAGRELPLEDQGALSLTVSLSGAAQIRHIPMSRAADNYTRHVIRGELSAQGVIQFSGSTTTRGEDAPGLRHDLAVREQQLDMFRRELAEVFPSVQVDSVAVHGAEVLSSSVSVEFQGALNSAAIQARGLSQFFMDAALLCSCPCQLPARARRIWCCPRHGPRKKKFTSRCRKGQRSTVTAARPEHQQRFWLTAAALQEIRRVK